jgi:hypothetical protein
MIYFCNKSFNIILKFSRNVHKLIHFPQFLWTNQNQTPDSIAKKNAIDFERPDLLHHCLVIWKPYLCPDWPGRGATLYSARNVRWLGPTRIAMALKTPITWTKEISLKWFKSRKYQLWNQSSQLWIGGFPITQIYKVLICCKKVKVKIWN